jgi:hypothetical protein
MEQTADAGDFLDLVLFLDWLFLDKLFLDNISVFIRCPVIDAVITIIPLSLFNFAVNTDTKQSDTPHRPIEYSHSFPNKSFVPVFSATILHT